MKTSVMDSKQAVNAPLTAAGAAIDTCKFCRLRLKPKAQPRRFCSSRHRLLFWAAGEILVEWKKGRADGLRDIIQELVKVKR
jgi:hypothetical protein